MPGFVTFPAKNNGETRKNLSVHAWQAQPAGAEKQRAVSDRLPQVGRPAQKEEVICIRWRGKKKPLQ